MQLSDVIANYFNSLGLKHVFAISGGASLHLIHSFDKFKDINIICCHNEQSSAMAADAYSRVKGKPSLAIATSGPGATNLITGIAGCFYDSIPAIFITGQVSTFRSSKDLKVRQIGFQETPIVKMCNEIVKYSVQINNPNEILKELQKAYYISITGRPGPVLIDIPDNIQRKEVECDLLEKFQEPKITNLSRIDLNLLNQLKEKISKSFRPIIIAGSGIKLSNCEKLFEKFVEITNIPVALTWGAIDLLDKDNPLRIGGFGTHGNRFSNLAVQNSDLIISLGSRLDLKATGSPPSTFAREAWKCMVDIDPNEINKFDNTALKINQKINCDLKTFFDLILQGNHIKKRYPKWESIIRTWKKKYCPIKESYSQNVEGINPYIFMREVFNLFGEKSQFFLDTGCALAWAMQTYEPYKDQNIYHDFNNTAMGWALPASIGGYLANHKKTVCITGDGSFMMNIQELATINHYKIPVTIFIINNGGYSMIKQTQDQWLNSNYLASSPEGGVGFPCFQEVGKGFGIESHIISQHSELKLLKKIISKIQKPIIIEILIDQNWRVTPQVKFGRPNEDQEPYLKREIFFKEMLIKPIDQN